MRWPSFEQLTEWKTLRILHLDTQKTWRGGENQLYLTVRRQVELGHVVAVACSEKMQLAVRAVEAGAVHLPWRAISEFDFIAGWRLRRLVSEFRPDVIHAHDSRSVAFLGKSGGPLRVAHRRVDFPIKGSGKYIRGSDVVIAISRAIEKILEAGGIPGEKIRVVYSGIAPERFSGRPKREEARRIIGVPEGKSLVVSVGALVEHKAHDTGVDAMAILLKRFPAAEWWVAGDGALSKRLEARSGEYGLDQTGQVRFLGHREDVPILLAAADLYYHPSRLEGLGTAIIDAMCCGLAVVATRIGGVPEIVVDRETGLLAAVDEPDDHAAKLLELLSEPDRAAEMGRRGLERFNKEFTGNRMADAILDIYKEMLDNSGADDSASKSAAADNL